ncbi:MAG: dinitrogenase iron-molybdenum cofactor biosynthesis protein, partial [Proteobacteria bacterium]|nr:dinitrogenase iron-molybdenum cofactor biosynthesis protein [Pseudomonadota bacterium]
TAANVPHVQGGCLAPVNLLHSLGAQALIAGGMGMRPLTGFHSVGITVFHHQGRRTAREAVESLIAGQLPQFGRQHTCGGGQDDHHGHGGCRH